MLNFCKKITKASTVKIYKDEKLVANATTYINIAVQPLIQLCQRICKCDDHLRVCIHIFNYEKFSLENTYLVYRTIVPAIFEVSPFYLILKNNSDCLMLKLPELLPQSITTVIIYVRLLEEGKFKSCVNIKAYCSGSNKLEIIKQCICNSDIKIKP